MFKIALLSFSIIILTACGSVVPEMSQLVPSGDYGGNEPPNISDTNISIFQVASKVYVEGACSNNVKDIHLSTDGVNWSNLPKNLNFNEFTQQINECGYKGSFKLALETDGSQLGFSEGAFGQRSVYVKSEYFDGFLSDALVVNIHYKDKIHSGQNIMEAGRSHGCMLSSGSVYCWGDNAMGQMGTGDMYMRNEPQIPDFGFPEKFKDVATGDSFSCALTEGGEVYCWGDNNSGQIGQGTDSNSSPSVTMYTNPQKLDQLSNIVDISAGLDHACALEFSGSIYCWGNNSDGQIGQDFTTSSYATPTLLEFDFSTENLSVDHLVLGQNISCALLTDMSKVNKKVTRCWGSIDATQSYVPISHPDINDTVNIGLVALGKGISAFCYTDAANSDQLYCYDGAAAFSVVPGQPTTGQLQSIYMNGGSEVCLLNKSSGIVGRYCLGTNSMGELGNGSMTNLTSLTLINDNGLEFSHLAMGNDFTCGFSLSNDVQCWGNNMQNQLIKYKGDFFGSPVKLESFTSGREILRIESGTDFKCALVKSANPAINEVQCWGSNSWGKLGVSGINTGAVYHSHLALTIPNLINPSKLKLGSHHACVIDSLVDGSYRGVFCWGNNNQGQLGNDDRNSPTEVYHPVQVVEDNLLGTGEEFKTLALGENHSCGISTDNITYCWGGNSSQQAGQMSAGPFYTPTIVNSGGNAQKIVSGLNFNCILKSVDDKVYCWGENSQAQLGNGTINNANNYTPAPVNIENPGGGADISLTSIIDIDAGATSVYAVSSVGKLHSWGGNSFSQLGYVTALFNYSKYATSLPNFGTLTSQSLKAGPNNIYVRTDLGDIFSWGQNTQYQTNFFEGGTNIISTPLSNTTLPSDLSELSLAEDSVCYSNSAEEIYCWGNNLSSQVGTEYIMMSDLPLHADF
ncbi:MAG: hypothetical protein HOO06_04610 [Bdellovibrionaceae bacterium]|jgi:alpha-tubulin suppressor-like RCC1 family protein|nr:hypothetical protein [Pseudobdellovibrionaceae bacterium]